MDNKDFESWFQDYIDKAVANAHFRKVELDTEQVTHDVKKQFTIYQRMSYVSGWREGLMYLQGLIAFSFKKDYLVERMLDKIHHAISNIK